MKLTKRASDFSKKRTVQLDLTERQTKKLIPLLDEVSRDYFRSEFVSKPIRDQRGIIIAQVLGIYLKAQYFPHRYAQRISNEIKCCLTDMQKRGIK